jgi:hypothetical protein
MISQINSIDYSQLIDIMTGQTRWLDFFNDNNGFYKILAGRLK